MCSSLVRARASFPRAREITRKKKRRGSGLAGIARRRAEHRQRSYKAASHVRRGAAKTRTQASFARARGCLSHQHRGVFSLGVSSYAARARSLAQRAHGRCLPCDSPTVRAKNLCRGSQLSRRASVDTDLCFFALPSPRVRRRARWLAHRDQELGLRVSAQERRDGMASPAPSRRSEPRVTTDAPRARASSGSRARSRRRWTVTSR